MLQGLALSCFGLVPLMCSSEQVALFCALVPLSVGASMLYAVIPGFLTKRVPAEDTGTVLGLDMASGSFSSIVCPLLSDWIYRSHGFVAVAWASFAVGGITLFVASVAQCGSSNAS